MEMKYFAPLPMEEQLHCRRVAAVSKLIAEARGFSTIEAEAIEQAAMFHDVGQSGTVSYTHPTLPTVCSVLRASC